MAEELLIDKVISRKEAHYQPFGWHHWPEYPWMSYQLRRALGETQEGGGTVSECFLAASRMIPGDKESWHKEWKYIADFNQSRGDDEISVGHIRTAMNCWLRAANYYRHAAFWLLPEDPRRLEAFTDMENCSRKFLEKLNPAGEVLQIPYNDNKTLFAYFVRAPFDTGRQPCLISMGGLDSIKDEMWFMQAHAALQRGISVLMIDGPGQGGALCRHGITTRYDYEVPIGKCIDYLETRDDVDSHRIAVCGSSLGGYYAARAGSYEHRLAATISHGAIWSIPDLWANANENHGLADHLKWVFGAKSVKEAMEIAKPFTLAGALENMRCPYLIVHGGYDVLGVRQAKQVYDYAKSHGVDVTLRYVTQDETGAEHCQHDNPTIGQELMADWLADRFGVDQKELSKKMTNPLI
ncbi:MAG: alpha/beta hydrolase [Casimicrobiaceae bacterium]